MKRKMYPRRVTRPGTLCAQGPLQKKGKKEKYKMYHPYHTHKEKPRTSSSAPTDNMSAADFACASNERYTCCQCDIPRKHVLAIRDRINTNMRHTRGRPQTEINGTRTTARALKQGTTTGRVSQPQEEGITRQANHWHLPGNTNEHESPTHTAKVEQKANYPPCIPPKGR